MLELENMTAEEMHRLIKEIECLGVDARSGYNPICFEAWFEGYKQAKWQVKQFLEDLEYRLEQKEKRKNG